MNTDTPSTPSGRRPTGSGTAGAEQVRLSETRERKADWYRWGPYLSERQWGTVREDYSADGAAWAHFPHDHARSRAYRWGEDGIAGLSDRHALLCFGWAFWNGHDPILKERLFGLTNSEGNHGEDVKEYYHHLDSTPTHSYMKYLYRYPQAEFPYEILVQANRSRSALEPEFELIDTGVFDDGRYFDIVIEYAKASPDDILIRATIHNRGPEAARIFVLPSLWFRNTWAWGHAHTATPELSLSGGGEIEARHPRYGKRWLRAQGDPTVLFADNETNAERLFGSSNRKPFPKDAFHDHVVDGRNDAVNPQHSGTKSAFMYRLEVGARDAVAINLRLSDSAKETDMFHEPFDRMLMKRRREADEFFQPLAGAATADDHLLIQRQALAGLAWSKQCFHYDVKAWQSGDPSGPPPAPQRRNGRNRGWEHLHTSEVLLMPDKWEFPWFASWDSAFHCVAYSMADPDFAKDQLLRFLREWYMHPNGQIPAYEWDLGDVNPPVHAWACWRVFEMHAATTGSPDSAFLEEAFHKLLLNFTWWVNRKDPAGRNVFEGGFLGLDNIGLFDRSHPPPMGGKLEQCDGTSWMAMYCLNMLTIAKRLALDNSAYEGIANKFLEHFVQIAHAMHDLGGEGIAIWDEEDGFYYDVLHWPGKNGFRMKVRSMVGLVPLFAIAIVEPEELERMPAFTRRKEWFLESNEDAQRHIVCSTGSSRLLLAIVTRERLERVLQLMLDESEFLSPFGIRSLSKTHEANPYRLDCEGEELTVAYEPGESTSGMFGGNSNWRGPVWMPMNYQIIEALKRFHEFYGDSLKVECPRYSGTWMNLAEVANEIARRVCSLFTLTPDGRRPAAGGNYKMQEDWNDCVPFYEYYHAETGAGLGAGHQTGWSALAALMLRDYA